MSPSRPFRLVVRGPMGLLAGLFLFLGAARAESPPPILPGLWEVRSQQLLNGRPMPDMSEQIRKMPPAVQAQMREQMRAKGVDLGGDGAVRTCHTRESIAQSRWRDAEGSGRCTTEPRQTGGSHWTWHSACKNPDMEIDGEAVFADPKAYTVTLDMRPTSGARAGQAMRMVMKARWLEADCGSVAPIRPRP